MMIDYRRKTTAVSVGDIRIGGDAPIAVQSMLSRDMERRSRIIAVVSIRFTSLSLGTGMPLVP